MKYSDTYSFYNKNHTFVNINIDKCPKTTKKRAFAQFCRVCFVVYAHTSPFVLADSAEKYYCIIY